MISWLNIKNDTYVFKYKGFVKTLNSIKDLIVYSLAVDVSIDEIEYALVEMNDKDHNYCEFGVFKNLIYTKKV